MSTKKHKLFHPIKSKHMDNSKFFIKADYKYDTAIEYFNDVKRGVYSVSNSFELVDNKMMYQPHINAEYLTVHDKLGALNTVNAFLPNVDALRANSVAIDNSRTAIKAFTGLSDSFVISDKINPNVISIPTWQNEILVDNKFFSPGSMPISSPPAIHASRDAISIDQLPGFIKGTASIDPFAEARMGVLNVKSLPGVADRTMKIDQFAVPSMGTVNVDSLSAFTIKSSVARATEYTMWAEKSILTINNDNLGQTIGLMPNTNGSLVSVYNDLSNGYSSLVTSFNNNPLSYTDIHPSISKCIPKEYFLNANLYESISNPGYLPYEEQIESDIQEDNENVLAEFLPRIGEEYNNLWQGALDAYNSDGAEKVRHFSISTRELFSHILRELAPDDEVKKWTDNASFYHKGKLTRGAKLKYISRNISNNSFKDFIAKDVAATLELLTLLNKGTHELNSGFTKQQFDILKTRAESTLKFILEVHFNSN